MKQISNILILPLTVLFWICFISTMLIFDVLQRLGHWIGGYEGLRRTVDIQNRLLLLCMQLHGTRVRFAQRALPEDETLVFVSNHQSMFDMPPMIWYLRRYHPKFIAKKELERRVPGISYNLRHGGSVGIDRRSRQEAVRAIQRFTQRIAVNGWSAIIYPEGTRSGKPEMKTWKKKGLATMLEVDPKLCIVPIRIDNSWKLSTARGWRIPFGVKMNLTMHPPMRLEGFPSIDVFIDALEELVRQPVID